MQQIFLLNKILAAKNEHITNVVFMGMGEPLANYASVMQAVRILHDPKCFNIGARKITISTVGVPTKMRELANENLPLNLALAHSDAIREQLAAVCKTLRANVNLIRYNEVNGLPFIRPRAEAVMRFQMILRENGVNAHVRKSRGRDIDAACGQLRRNEKLAQITIAKSIET